MVYCVGITGDIASGKTTVAELFSKLGMEVIYADKISRELTQKNKDAYTKILEHYGRSILKEDDELDRSKLREIIFSNHKERYWLEQLLHPLIRHEIKKRADECTTPYCVIEIPLLITKQTYPYIKRTLLVCAPKETQISRLMQRDQSNEKQAQAILSTQPDWDKRLENADDIIINNMGIEELTKRVHDLHYRYLQEAKKDQ